MLRPLFETVSESEKSEAIASIVSHATPRQDFFVMMGLSVSMAVFGILLDSVVILIGSMLIAPLLYPLLSLALGVITTDFKLMAQSSRTLVKSTAYALAAGFVISFASLSYLGNPTPTPLFIFISGPSSIMYAIVAVIAGFAAALAMTKPHLNESLPGVAISVALVPPLAMAGVALSAFDWNSASNALTLFLLNVVGIVLSSMFVFSMFGFSVKKKATQEAVKEGEKIVEKEVRIATEEKKS